MRCRSHGAKEVTTAGRVSAGTHGATHCPMATTVPSTHPPTPCAPSRRQNLLSGDPEPSLHVINCNNWQVGFYFWLSIHQGLMKKQNPKALGCSAAHISMGLERRQPLMTRNKLWAAAVLGKQEIQNSLKGPGSFGPRSACPLGEGGSSSLACCPSWECRCGEERRLVQMSSLFRRVIIT